jgi:ABC-type uncharacterized transport system ATPase subunit
VKDDLVRGLLASSGAEGCTILLCSHDIGELELLADWFGFMDRGAVRLSAPMDQVREQFVRVDLTLPDDRSLGAVPAEWMSVETAGRRMGFVVRAESQNAARHMVQTRLGETADVQLREASLREVFVALASHLATQSPAEAA